MTAHPRSGTGSRAAALRQLSTEAFRFRRLVIDTLGAQQFVYLNADRFIGACPICGAAVRVHFAGYAPRATLQCHGGCTEAEIADAVGLAVRP